MLTNFVRILILAGIATGYTVYNPFFHFPGASEVYNQMIVTIAVPLEIPTPTPGEILFNTIFAAEYFEPTNETTFEYPPIISDETSSSERGILYRILARRIQEFGYSGKSCLLRAVCEISQHSTQHTSLLGDIIHILLTPSSSVKEKNLDDYEEAERLGNAGRCGKYSTKCNFSVLEAISKLGNYLG